MLDADARASDRRVRLSQREGAMVRTSHVEEHSADGIEHAARTPNADAAAMDIKDVTGRARPVQGSAHHGATYLCVQRLPL